MKTVLRCYCATVLLLTSLQTIHASNVGKAGAQFLKIGTGARAMGMGGAFGAVAGDIGGMNWNPAGLGAMEKREISTTYLKYFEGVDYGHLGYAHPTARGTVGIGVTYLTLDGIEARATDTVAADREFGADDMAVNVTFAKKGLFSSLSEDLTIGITGKYISMKLDDETATTGALDVGMLYNSPWEGLDIGLTLQNMGPGPKFVEESDPLPLNLKLGVAYRTLEKKLLLSMDIDQNLVEKKAYGSLGTEYSMKALSVRAGYKFGQDTDNLGALAGLGVGIGIRVYSSQIDYAFVPFGDLGDTHRFSLSLRF